MANYNASNQTQYFGFPLFESGDKPSWLTDWNGVVEELDDILEANRIQIEANTQGMSSFLQQISAIRDMITAINGRIDGDEMTITDMMADLEGFRDLLVQTDTSVKSLLTRMNTAETGLSSVVSDVTALTAYAHANREKIEDAIYATVPVFGWNAGVNWAIGMQALKPTEINDNPPHNFAPQSATIYTVTADTTGKSYKYIFDHWDEYFDAESGADHSTTDMVLMRKIQLLRTEVPTKDEFNTAIASTYPVFGADETHNWVYGEPCLKPTYIGPTPASSNFKPVDNTVYELVTTPAEGTTFQTMFANWDSYFDPVIEDGADYAGITPVSEACARSRENETSINVIYGRLGGIAYAFEKAGTELEKHDMTSLGAWTFSPAIAGMSVTRFVFKALRFKYHTTNFNVAPIAIEPPNLRISANFLAGENEVIRQYTIHSPSSGREDFNVTVVPYGDGEADIHVVFNTPLILLVAESQFHDVVKSVQIAVDTGDARNIRIWSAIEGGRTYVSLAPTGVEVEGYCQ